MKLSLNGIKEQEAWEKAGITLPGYDVEAVSAESEERTWYGYISESEIFSAYLSVVLLTDFWKRACLTVALPVWRLLIMM